MMLRNVNTGEIIDAAPIGAWALPQYLAGDWAIESGDVSDISTVRTTAEVVAEAVVLASNNSVVVAELLTAYPEAGDLLAETSDGGLILGQRPPSGPEAKPASPVGLLAILGAAWWLLS